jgi:hypothetical protein
VQSSGAARVRLLFLHSEPFSSLPVSVWWIFHLAKIYNQNQSQPNFRHLQRPSCWTACSLGFALWYRHVQQNDERWGPWNHVALVFAHPSSQPRARHPSRWTLPVDKLSGAPRWNESRVTNATKSLTMSWCCKSKPFLNVLSAHDSTLLKQLNLSATATFGTFWDNLWFFYEASKKACVRSFSGDLVASLRQI